jgi:hypothetical protein
LLLQLQKLLLEVGDRLCPLIKLGILCLGGILEMHDHVGASVHLLTSEVKLSTGEVPPVIDLSKAVVCSLQLQIHLCRLTCPMMEDGILMLKPLHRVLHEGILPDVRIQTHTLLGGDSASVVLLIEQIPYVLGQV